MSPHGSSPGRCSRRKCSFPHLWVRRLLVYGPGLVCISCQGEYAKAGELYERCQAIQEKVLGPEHPSLATTLGNRAVLLQAQVRAGRVVEGTVCLRMVKIAVLRHRAVLLGSADESGRIVEGSVVAFNRLMVWRTRTSRVVDEMCPRCAAVDPTSAEMWFCLAINCCLSGEGWPCPRSFDGLRCGERHRARTTEMSPHGSSPGRWYGRKCSFPHLGVQRLLAYGPGLVCISRQGEYAKAGELYERSQAIQEKVLGPEHPSLAATLHSRAYLLQAQVRAGGVVKGNILLRMAKTAVLRYRAVLLGSADESRQVC